MKKLQGFNSPLFKSFKGAQVNNLAKILGGADPKKGDATQWTGGERDEISEDGGNEVKVFD